MGVINDYVNADTAANKLVASVNSGKGQKTVTMIQTFEVAAADSDGSIYRIFKNLDPELIPVNIQIANDAITAGTVYDVGLYETLNEGQGGTVVSDAVFASALDLSSAHVSGSELSAISAIDQANRSKRIWELAGHTQATKKAGYDLCLTADTVGSAAGTITVIATFALGN